MSTMKTIRMSALWLILPVVLVAVATGCAHRRQSYYPSDVANPGPGVHVRAPFVDVQVKGRPKTDREERAARRDDDRDRDEDDRD